MEKNAELFIRLCREFDISNDDFIRTTQERHEKVVQLVFRKVSENGDIYKDFYEGHYCVLCEEFKTEKDLARGKCPEHEIEPEHLKEENYFFRNGKYKKEIMELLNRDFILPQRRRREVIDRIQRIGLKDLSVSRPDLEWGIDTPIDAKHKIYVWFDALVNYISALGYPDSERYRRFWPADLHVIGKGINWFHSVIWPSILLSAGIPLPEHILVHGYLTIEGKKISKSSKLTIDALKLAKKYSVDAIRYYLIREIPFDEDGDFREENLIEKNNNELVANVGNFIHRVLSFAWKSFNGKVPEPIEFEELDKELVERMVKIAKETAEQLEKFKLDKALAKVNQFAIFCNRYFQKKEPWKTNDTNCMYLGINAVGSLAILLEPFVPSSSERLWNMLDLGGEVHDQDWYSASELAVEAKHQIRRPKPPFKRL